MPQYPQQFLIHQVKRYDLKGKKILEFFEKYYLEDVGLRSFFLGYESRDVGRILENIVFLELKSRGYDISIGKINDLEIDFVAKKNGETLLIQVSYDISHEKTKKRELSSLLKDRSQAKKLIITMNEFEGEFIEEIHHKFAIDWLLEK